MGEAKRYYWLRLHDDFFDSKRIKKLRTLAGGDTFTIIYLKMQLKAMKTDGVLEYTGVEPTMAEEIALDIDEKAENVQVTLNYLINCGLAELDGNGDCFLPYAIENTGSETASTQRSRACRSRQRETKMLQCNTDATQLQQTCSVEKEIEKEKELEKKNINAFAELAGEDKELLEALKAFENMRKKIKKPIEDRARTMLVNKLKEFPREDWIAIIDQSIFHNWQSFYPLKTTESYAKETWDKEPIEPPTTIRRNR